MQKIVIYTPLELAGMVFGAVGAGSGVAWLDGMRRSIAGMVKRRPQVYRTFGPYWWAVKAQLVDNGLMTGELDETLAEAIGSGDAMQDMAGAVAYHGFNTDQMRDTNTFAVNTADGDTFDYVLHDPEIEAMIAGR